MDGYYFGAYCCLETDSKIGKSLELMVQKAKSLGYSYVVKYTPAPFPQVINRVIIGWNTRKINFAQACEEFKHSAEKLSIVKAFKISRGVDDFLLAPSENELEIVPLNEFEGYQPLMQ